MNMKKTIGMLLAAGIVGLSTAVLSAVSVGDESRRRARQAA